MGPIVFFGTNDFAAVILEHLLQEKLPVVAVVTRPDRMQGRGRKVRPPVVKELLLSLGSQLPILQPEKVSTPEFLEQLRPLQADFFVVAAFGEIMKQFILDLPALACLNVHASLLPHYRGAAPIQRALWNGDLETGVTIQEMVLKLDAGDILASCSCGIQSSTTLGELKARLAELSGPLLADVLRNFSLYSEQRRRQEENLVTMAPKILESERKINFMLPAATLHNHIRALSPEPAAWALIRLQGRELRIKLLRSSVAAEGSSAGLPGAVFPQKGALIVQCGEGALELLEVQPEGKRAMSGKDFIIGSRGELFLT